MVNQSQIFRALKNLLLAFGLLAMGAGGITGESLPPSEGWANFVLQEGSRWAVRMSDAGTVTSLYGMGRSRGATPDGAASTFLKSYHKLLGIERVADLRLTQTDHTLLGTHYRYRQYHGGLPVVMGEVNVHVNKGNVIIAANSSYSALHGTAGTVRNVEQAFPAVRRLLGEKTHITPLGLMVFPQGRVARPVWRLVVETGAGRSWLLYVDAAQPNVILQAARTFLTVDGEGNVWAENPVVTPQRLKQKLPNLDASTALSGRYARTYNANFQHGLLDLVIPVIPLSKFTTAKRPDRKFNYAESDARLAETMAYYHINRVHGHWRRVGFRGLDARAPVFVNIAYQEGGPGWDNAQYLRSTQFPKTGVYLFGAGQKFQNLGLDGDVYYHEYGHGVLDRIAPGLLEARESIYPLAFHEGFADISACSLTGNSKMGEYASFNKQTAKWEGRNLDNKKRYPAHVIAPVIRLPEPHYTGLIVGGSWWDLQKQIGSRNAQVILYQSLRLLPSEMNFFDLRDAMAAADASLNGGTNSLQIATAFAKHGILGPNTGQKGTLKFKGVIVAGGPPNQNAQIKSVFRRGDLIYLIAEYEGTGLSPGYNLVPTFFNFSGPSTSNAFAWPLISNVTNGVHHGLKGVHLYEVDTDAETTPGTYTFTLASRLGGSNQAFPQTTVGFTLN